MPFDPLFTGIAQGIESAAGDIIGKVKENKRKNEAVDTFYSILDSLKGDLTPKIQYADDKGNQVSRSDASKNMGTVDPRGLTQPNPNPVQQQQGPIDYNAAAEHLTKGMQSMYGFSDEMPQGANLVAQYYELMAPNKKTVKIGNTVGEYDAKTGEFNVLYEDPKETTEKNIGSTYATKLDDGTYKLAIDTYGKDGYKTQYVRDLTKTEIDEYERSIQEDQADLDRKLNPKSPGHRGPGKIKMPEVPTTPEQNQNKVLIDEYAKLKNRDWNKLTAKEKKRYKELNNTIRTEYNQDPDELTNYIYGSNMTSKKKDATEYNSFAKERQDLIDEQYNTMMDTWNQVSTAITSGKMTQEQAIKYMETTIKNNKSVLTKEVLNLILDSLANIGVHININ